MNEMEMKETIDTRGCAFVFAYLFLAVALIIAVILAVENFVP